MFFLVTSARWLIFKFFNSLEKYASTPHWSTFCHFFDEIGVLQSTRRRRVADDPCTRVSFDVSLPFMAQVVARPRAWTKVPNFRYQRCPFLRGEMVPRVPRGSPLSMKSYVQYIARDVRWYIIVKSYFSYDGGGPPVGVYGKVSKWGWRGGPCALIYLHGHIYYKL